MAWRVAFGLLVVSSPAGALTGFGSPYGGTAAQIPGVVEVEEFDDGGQGVAYVDTDAWNPGDFRTTEGVDVYSINNGYGLTYLKPGEWIRYTVNVTTDVDAFDLSFLVAASDDKGSFNFIVGERGCNDVAPYLSVFVDVPDTGSHITFKDFIIPGKSGLDAGLTYVWMCVITGYEIDSFAMMPAALTPSPAPTPSPTAAPTPSPTTAPTQSPTTAATLPPTTVPTPPPPGTIPEGPYGGTAVQVPGKIEAEEFDFGGQGVGYSDSTAGNKGGVFRTEEDVDIKARETGYKVGAFDHGEYLRYTVDVTQNVEFFFFTFLVASNRDSASFRVVSGGTGCDHYYTDLSGLVSVPNTGAWTKYENFEVSGEGNGGLDSGITQIWLCALSKYFNLDSFTMSAATIVSTPYSGTPAVIPGIIEAEEFDFGGQGLAYSDTTTANSGEVFRTDESVDVGSTTDGYFVGWTRAGEYLQYSVYISEDVHAFDFSFLVSGPPEDFGSFQIVAGGKDCDTYDTPLTGVVTAPSDGWRRYSAVEITNGATGGMAAGPGVIRLCVISKRFNIGFFEMTAHI